MLNPAKKYTTHTLFCQSQLCVYVTKLQWKFRKGDKHTQNKTLVNSRTAKAMWRDPMSKRKKNTAQFMLGVSSKAHDHSTLLLKRFITPL